MVVLPRDLPALLEATLRRLGVPDDAPLVAAVSGGPDSVALLAALADRETLRQRTTVGHVDHGLRAESAAEAKLVENLCGKLRIPFRATRLNIDKAAVGNLSARLRDARYEFLLGLVPPAGFLLTAHHADDQAVTLLMRLFEGASLPGLAGMRPRREVVIRPFLEVPRRSLETFLAEQGLPHCQDASNLDESKYRNRIRQRVWAPLVAVEPQAGRRVALAALRLREDDEALQAWANRILAGARIGGNWVEVPQIEEVPAAVLRRILSGVLSMRWGRGPVQGEQWATVLDDLARGARANLPGRVTIEMHKNGLLFVASQTTFVYQLDIRAPGDYVLPVGILQVNDALVKHGPFQVRNLLPGDRFLKPGFRAAAKVQEWLKDLGIPRHRRAGWPVVPLGDGSAVPAFPTSEGRSFSSVNGDSTLRFRSELSEGIQGLRELAQKL